MIFQSVDVEHLIYTSLFFTAIKSALSKEDLAPDIEEKLMQLQKYNSEQTKKDEGTGLLTTSSAAVTTNSATRNTTSKRIRDQVRCLVISLKLLPNSSSLEKYNDHFTYFCLVDMQFSLICFSRSYLSILMLLFVRK